MTTRYYALFLLLVGACGGGSAGTDDMNAPADLGQVTTPADASMPADASPVLVPTTTIAAARAGNVMTPIVVKAVVMGTHSDNSWYIEDPAGGPNSGVIVYCEPGSKSCPAAVTKPKLHDQIVIAGSLSLYKGRMEFDPTAQNVTGSNAALPAPVPVTMADVAPAGMSNLRGTYVTLSAKLTVDNVTPMSLYDTNCATVDGGVTDDAGVRLCTGCAPASYSGFQANDGAGHEVLIEEYFYATEALASSPECVTQMGAVVVKSGMTFSKVSGILDFDTYGLIQFLAPIQDSDYTTP